MGYTIILLVLGIRAHERGRPAWKTGVRDGVLFYPSEKTMGHAAQMPTPLVTIPQSHPPMPQQYLPSSVLHTGAQV